MEESKKQKYVILRRIKPPEDETDIQTPSGTYRTSVSLAQALEEFYRYDPDAYQGVSGGRYSYEFTPTSLGLVLVVKDNLHKREINVTNYSDW